LNLTFGGSNLVNVSISSAKLFTDANEKTMIEYIIFVLIIFIPLNKMMRAKNVPIFNNCINVDTGSCF